MSPTIATTPESINHWSLCCLNNKLWAHNGLGRLCFEGRYPIYALAVLPDIGWCMLHDLQTVVPPNTYPILSTFVREEHRRQGHGTALYKALTRAYPCTFMFGHSDLALPFYQHCKEVTNEPTLESQENSVGAGSDQPFVVLC
jgi:GNAT superfamily N-acetyltransferase